MRRTACAVLLSLAFTFSLAIPVMSPAAHAAVIRQPAAAVQPARSRAQIRAAEHLFHLEHLKHLRHLLYLKLMASHPHSPPAAAVTASAHSSGGLGGTLSCSGLEALWEAAGGSSGEAFMAAEIAMAESGGQQYAVSPSDDYGYWQINMPSWGPGMASFVPIVNAESAIKISQDGSNWSPWTTYTSGAYEGRC